MNTIAYADDIAIMEVDRSPLRLETRIQESVDKKAHICKRLGLQLAPEKSSILVLGGGKKSKLPHIVVYETAIKVSKEVKYLGITLDSSLSFRNHLKKTRTRALQRMGTIRWLAHRNRGHNAKALINCYKSYIRPILEYGGSIWMKAAKSNLECLDRIQQLFLSWCLGTPWFAARKNVNRATGVAPLQERREATTLVMRSRKTGGGETG
jgi:hypothetical protein